MCRYITLSIIYTLRELKEYYSIFVINWGIVENTDFKEHVCTMILPTPYIQC